MAARRPNAPDDIGRPPFNNLLRRLSDSDFGLIAPHVTRDVAKANDLLYNPGDDVEIVHFPCGPSLVSYIVPNEDGSDVEAILVGREGAVGGIVSEGYLPAYTRIMVKFGGPFVRLRVGKLNAAKAKSTTLRNVSRVIPTAYSPRCSSRRPVMRSIQSNSARRNGLFRRWKEPRATMSWR